jgi:enamine deaminase RidA (YjgF/YER057c/UK114 family)
LPRAAARVGCDAVALGSGEPAAVTVKAGVAVMPRGGKIFVSGQAKRAADLRASVALTMDALHASVAQLGRAKSDIVHVKGFITPFADHAIARAEIARSFPAGPVPPIVLIEWQSDLATEIELVVADPAAAAESARGEGLTFAPLAGLSPSPLFSRVAIVSAGAPLIFLGGIDGGPSGSAREQWQHVFAQLAGALLDSGSSFRHLAKATYFLADPDARKSLGEIRGVYYDPTRPPAASALDVKSIGRPGRRVALDLIAVPAGTTAK